MSTATTQSPTTPGRTVGPLTVVALLHPQGCRTYVLADPVSAQALALDVHLDLVDSVEAAVTDAGWTLPYIVDSHTHADHPSGAAALAARFSSTRIAHAAAGHAGVTRHPADGDTLHLGDQAVLVRHAPGHTPDHIVLLAEGAAFTGDTVLLGSVARTDFLGGDAGQLFDSIQRVLEGLPDETLLYPGHDYAGREHSTVGVERRDNPWLQFDRATFIEKLTANPPARPANMDALLDFNRKGAALPTTMSAAEALARVRDGGVASIIDVRTGGEFAAEHIAGSHGIPLDQVTDRVDAIRAVPAPRLLLCRTGNRAELAQKALAPFGLAGLTIVDGGLEAYASLGGETVKGSGAIALDRQMRIIAGALVLLGTVLGAFVAPVFYALSAFVGAGLIFAGVTNACPMMAVIAKMPWNRAPASAGAPAADCAADGGGCAATPPPTVD